MAEQFLNKLNEIEKSIESLGETLKRMITILSTLNEIKSEVRVSKEEIIDRMKKIPAQPAGATSDEAAQKLMAEVQSTKEELVSAMSAMAASQAGVSREEVNGIVKSEIDELGKFIMESLEDLKGDVLSAVKSAPIPAPAAAQATAETVPVASESTLAPDRAMKIADQLQMILDSLKMGCVAGDVLETMNEAKSNIMSIVPSDPIMVKIDKWAGVVKSYSKRHELQARDILKLKKDLRQEIPKYRPA